MGQGLIDIRALGVPELERDLRRLDAAMQKKIVKKAMTEAAKPIKKAIQARIPGSGENHTKLRRGIKSRAMPRSRRGFGRHVRLPTREELGIPTGTKHYWPAALEYGHKIVRGGRVVGQVAPRSFMRAGYDASERVATSILKRKIREGIDMEARKR